MVQLDLNMPDPFEIVLGTYEQFLLGYKVANVVNEYKMEKSFAVHSHQGSVRSVHSNKHYLASGGADDSIYLYDTRYRAETGRLMHHNDTVNCVTFSPEASHLFTCSNDGTIAAIRCGNWQVEKHWQKPHNGLAVNTLAIHPTGKIALSTGADGTLRTWNLVKGRQAYATNLVPRLKLDAKNVSVLRWSPNGEKYLLAVNQKIDIYSVESAGISGEIKVTGKLSCVEFLQDDLIAVGLEDGRIEFYDLRKPKKTVDKVAHAARVKCMAHNDNLLVTASSSGEIKLWKFAKCTLDLLETIDCGARITCLSLAKPCKVLKQEKEAKAEEKNAIQKAQKFRLKQEVIIEDEGNWEVSDVKGAKQNLSLKSKKKVRSRDDSQDTAEYLQRKEKKMKGSICDSGVPKSKRNRDVAEDTSVDDGSHKKKKLKTVDSTDQNVILKKRKKHTSNEIVPSPIKKKKNILDPYITLSSKKAKKKLTISNNEDTPPNKKKKIVMEQTTVSLKKKKKKQ